MDCLWLTLADPEPATNGQLIYSKGLIEAACLAGASLTVIGLARPEKQRTRGDNPALIWRLEDERHAPRWRRLLSLTPQVATRAFGGAQDRSVDRALSEFEGHWEAVIFDSICAGWALDTVLRHRDRSTHPPKLVYIAHNHERTVARRIADAARGARRLLKELDALKVKHLEKRLIAEADLITSNTPDDCRIFAAESTGRPVAYLPPGYSGPRAASRTIDSNVPRRAVMVGSFDWPPKRISLESFLAVADPILAGAGVELQVVGEVQLNYLDALRRRFPSVTFIGPVDDVRPYMAAARVALVPDLLGGFKLKGLDYVFNRLPILAMRAALPGMPLQDGSSIGLFDSHRSLANGVLSVIDDYQTLNARHERAFAACNDRFDWARIGRHLIARIRQVEHRRSARASIRSAASADTGGDRLVAKRCESLRDSVQDAVGLLHR